MECSKRDSERERRRYNLKWKIHVPEREGQILLFKLHKKQKKIVYLPATATAATTKTTT